MSYIFNADFIMDCRAYSFYVAYAKMHTKEQKDYILLLDELCKKSKHSAFHYEVLAFYRRQGIPTKALENRRTKKRHLRNRMKNWSCLRGRQMLVIYR